MPFEFPLAIADGAIQTDLSMLNYESGLFLQQYFLYLHYTICVQHVYDWSLFLLFWFFFGFFFWNDLNHQCLRQHHHGLLLFLKHLLPCCTSFFFFFFLLVHSITWGHVYISVMRTDYFSFWSGVLGGIEQGRMEQVDAWRNWANGRWSRAGQGRTTERGGPVRVVSSLAVINDTQ